MDGEADGLLLTFHDGFASGLVGTDRDQRDLPGWSFRTVFIDERKIHLLDDFQDGLCLKGRAVQPLLDLGQKLGVEGLGIQTLENLTVLIANAHGLLLSGTGFRPYYRR
jgi:hypothetical protein